MQTQDKPIACTLAPADLAARREEIRALLRRALIQRERGKGSLRLVFRHSEATEAAVRDLVRRESECCAFLSFALTLEADRIVLDVSGPPGSESVLNWI